MPCSSYGAFYAAFYCTDDDAMTYVLRTCAADAGEASQLTNRPVRVTHLSITTRLSHPLSTAAVVVTAVAELVYDSLHALPWLCKHHTHSCPLTNVAACWPVFTAFMRRIIDAHLHGAWQRHAGGPGRMARSYPVRSPTSLALSYMYRPRPGNQGRHWAFAEAPARPECIRSLHYQ